MCTLPCPFAFPSQQACGPCPSGQRAARRLNAQACQGPRAPAGAIDARQGADSPGPGGAALAGPAERVGAGFGAKSSLGAVAGAAIVVIASPSAAQPACECGPLASYLSAAFLVGVTVLVLGGALHWVVTMISAFKRERRRGAVRRAITKL